MTTDNPAAEATPIRRVILASFIGTTIEWYDFFLYGTAAALVFNKLFFPTFDPLAGTMAAFGTYAVGFFARPFGGVVFGHYGDKLGRKAMLVTTIMLMGLATFLIGVLPTYEKVGALAPVLLILLRFIQGFGVGGEWGGAVLMAVEHGHAGRRGFYASWVQAGVPVGLLLATAIFTLFSKLPENEFLSWGWRVPFLAGILLTGVGLFIRLRILETPLFAKMQSSQTIRPLPVLDVIRSSPKNVLLAMGVRFSENAAFYVFTVFLLSYATTQLKLSRDVVLNAVLLASAIHFFTIPAFGALSDKFGRRPVVLAGAVAMALFAFPFFWLVDTKSTGLIWLAVIVGLAVPHAAMYGPQAALLSELFGTGVRYSGVSLGYQLASPVAGGLAPLIAAALLKWSGGRPWPIAIYIVVMSTITFLSVWLAAETFNKDISRPENKGG